MIVELELLNIFISIVCVAVGWVAGWYFGYDRGRDDGFKSAIAVVQREFGNMEDETEFSEE